MGKAPDTAIARRPKRFFSALLRRRVVELLLILTQLAMIIFFAVSGSRQLGWLNVTLNAFSVFAVLYLVNQREQTGYKLIWSVLILIFPVFGGLFYIFFQFQTAKRRFRQSSEAWTRRHRALFTLFGDVCPEARAAVPDYAPLITYLHTYAGFPVYRRTAVTYFTVGEEKHRALLKALEGAREYIFLEYFIVEEGQMWDAVLAILAAKAQQGLDVRVMYDDMGCFLRLPKDYPQRLQKMGIRCTVFGSFVPLLSARQNNRDHRKIAVIDGRVAFTGGINLADEYINVIDRFGHWKDTAVMAEGEAAWCFTLLFLQMWAICNPDAPEEDYASLNPWQDAPYQGTERGFTQPYADSPMDSERVGENVYLRIINSAKTYLYINTPYFVIDDLVVSALCLAAKSGVDVRVATPHRPDKWYMQTVTRSYYRELIAGGVRVYEYTAGFLHAKSFVSDDRVAAVGTPNLDYRSLYLHFECGICLYDQPVVIAVRDDFLETLPRCAEVTEEDCQSGLAARFVQATLRLIAPLL